MGPWETSRLTVSKCTLPPCYLTCIDNVNPTSDQTLLHCITEKFNDTNESNVNIIKHPFQSHVFMVKREVGNHVSSAVEGSGGGSGEGSGGSGGGSEGAVKWRL